MADVIWCRSDTAKEWKKSKHGKVRRKHKTNLKSIAQVRDKASEAINPTYQSAGFGGTSAGGADKVRKQNTCSNCLWTTSHTLARCLKDKFYSTLEPLNNNLWHKPSMALELGDFAVVWDLETTGLLVYYQEPMEIGYDILCVVEGARGVLQFRQVGTTVAQLTLTDVAVSPEALATHGITPEKLGEGGVPLVTALAGNAWK